MIKEKKSSWQAKFKRILNSVLPVAKNRQGQCLQCGACCKLVVVCPFLRYNAENKSYCLIYPVRPFNCRKYPRTKIEFIIQDNCGFRFK